jgi:hypothetical protein
MPHSTHRWLPAYESQLLNSWCIVSAAFDITRIISDLRLCDEIGNHILIYESKKRRVPLGGQHKG